MNPHRIRSLSKCSPQTGPVVYWMSRDQRVSDNWALLHGIEDSHTLRQPMCVIFCLVNKFLGSNQQQYRFMLQSLQKVARQLQDLHIPFYLLNGNPEREIPLFIHTVAASKLIVDFSPLTLGRVWRENVAKQLPISVDEVDAHNIIPPWIVSQKQEFGAYTIRPKINRLLDEYLDEFPPLKKQTFSWNHNIPHIDWDDLIGKEADYTWIKSGENEAKTVLSTFLRVKLARYEMERNDPTIDGQSMLSPYLHFGQISAQRIALEVKNTNSDTIHAFLEELIVRRELAENFCFYNTYYSSVRGFPKWAQESLQQHRSDPREYVYTYDQFASAQTHESLWNATQQQLIQTGRIPGYLRMYWAKKILEWSASPEEALAIAIKLNDSYELDGRDPNGYTGIAWSIGGVHDRAWFDRPIFGKIRYMNENGARKKFDVDRYIHTWI